MNNCTLIHLNTIEQYASLCRCKMRYYLPTLFPKQSDCDEIELKTCSTNDECSCLGLYKCTDGVCKRKSSFRQAFSGKSFKSNHFFLSSLRLGKLISVNRPLHMIVVCFAYYDFPLAHTYVVRSCQW